MIVVSDNSTITNMPLYLMKGYLSNTTKYVRITVLHICLCNILVPLDQSQLVLCRRYDQIIKDKTLLLLYIVSANMEGTPILRRERWNV